MRTVRVHIRPDGEHHRVRWDDGNEHATVGLRPQTSIDLGDGRNERLNVLCGHLAEQDQETLRALGRHLWTLLQAPSGASRRAEIELRSDDLDVLALPWHLVYDGSLWMDTHAVGVRCTPRDGKGVKSLAKSIYLISGPPSPYTDGNDWSEVLQPLSVGTPHVTIALNQDELLAGLRNLDLLFLDVDTGKITTGYAEGTLHLESGLSIDWESLADAVKDHPPAIVLIECAGSAPYSLVRKAAALGEHSTVILLPRPSGGTPPPDTGDLARHFVEAFCIGGSSLTDTARSVAHERMIPTSQIPRIFGEPLSRKPPPSVEWRKGWDDPGWRVSLDRKEQAGRAIKAVKDAWETRDLGAGLVLIWQGPPHSGLMRFVKRLQHEVDSVERQSSEIIDIGWPTNDNPTVDDIAVLYEHSLGIAPGEVTDRVKVEASLTRAYPPSSTRHQVLFVTHGLIEAAFYPDERIDINLLEDYVKWWAHTLLPAVPQRITPVLLLALEDSPGGDWPPLPKELSQLGVLPCVVVGLRRLPDVSAEDVAEVIWRHRLPISSDARQGVAEEICHHTGGSFDDTVHAIDHLPWRWRDWWRSYKKRKRRK